MIKNKSLCMKNRLFTWTDKTLLPEQVGVNKTNTGTVAYIRV